VEHLALALFGLSVLALAAGLAKPALVIRWGTVRTRARAALVWGLAAMAFLLLHTALRQTPRPQDSGRPGLFAPRRAAVFSRLEITTVTAGDGLVRITGTTDLPDGALLVVDFDLAGSEAESETAVSEQTTVTAGAFSAVIEPPDTPEFDTGPYTVTVLFSPRIQPEHVLDLVGADGEQLAGPLAQETFGFRVLETTRKTALSLRPTET